MVWRALFRGFVQLHILHHASQEPVYGSWLIQELSRHNYQLSAGTLYPILHRMEEDGLLASSFCVIEGKRRRYYVATPDGEQALVQARRQALELVSEIAPPAMHPREREPKKEEQHNRS